MAVLGAERFLTNQVTATSAPAHPAAARLGEADGLVFYVMPYIEGESLRRQAHA